MGSVYSMIFLKGNIPPTIPLCNSTPTFDPQFGFEAPRKERVMKITKEEMDSLLIPPMMQDYCAHILKKHMVCLKKNNPFFILCTREKHAYHKCQVEDAILRQKEYEREKRLRIRQAKIEAGKQ